MPKNKSHYIVAVVTDDPDGWEIICKKKSKSMTFRLETKTGKLTASDIMFINSHFDALMTQPAVPASKEPKTA